ncbi:hypothetical protein BG004_000608 [Podila humilis]|nr:hypothetical protein BG004_000608 [Podila humilis]
MWPSGDLPDNSQKHVNVPLSHNEEINYVTATYANRDALCLALMSWAPPSTTNNYKERAGMITGDIFRLCGYSWNHSGQFISLEGRPSVHASCGWFGTDRGFLNLLNIILDVMGNHFLKGYANANLCGFGVGFQRAEMDQLHAPFKEIVAYFRETRRCLCPTSWGSSFLSIDGGIFCDMSTKTKIPICKVGETDGCFVYEKPRVNGRGGYSTKRNMYVKGSEIKYNATYIVLSDGTGRIVDDDRRASAFWAKRATFAQADVLANEAAAVNMEVGHHKTKVIFQKYLPPLGAETPDEDETEADTDEENEELAFRIKKSQIYKLTLFDLNILNAPGSLRKGALRVSFKITSEVTSKVFKIEH